MAKNALNKWLDATTVQMLTEMIFMIIDHNAHYVHRHHQIDRKSLKKNALQKIWKMQTWSLRVFRETNHVGKLVVWDRWKKMHFASRSGPTVYIL